MTKKLFFRYLSFVLMLIGIQYLNRESGLWNVPGQLSFDYLSPFVGAAVIVFFEHQSKKRKKKEELIA